MYRDLLAVLCPERPVSFSTGPVWHFQKWEGYTVLMLLIKLIDSNTFYSLQPPNPLEKFTKDGHFIINLNYESESHWDH